MLDLPREWPDKMHLFTHLPTTPLSQALSMQPWGLCSLEPQFHGKVMCHEMIPTTCRGTDPGLWIRTASWGWCLWDVPYNKEGCFRLNSHHGKLRMRRPQALNSQMQREAVRSGARSSQWPCPELLQTLLSPPGLVSAAPSENPRHLPRQRALLGGPSKAVSEAIGNNFNKIH